MTPTLEEHRRLAQEQQRQAQAVAEAIRAIIPNPQATIRTDPETGVDELVMDCSSIHLEYMDEGCVFLAVYLGNERVCLFLHGSATGRIVTVVSEDEIGCEYVHGDDE